MIKLAMLLFALVAIPTVAVNTARAQTGADACGADVEKYCKDVPVGGGRRYKCLKDHENELSAPCKKHIADVKGKTRGIHEACWDDVSRLCGDAAALAPATK
jgi:hypothetical protein